VSEAQRKKLNKLQIKAHESCLSESPVSCQLSVCPEALHKFSNDLETLGLAFRKTNSLWLWTSFRGDFHSNFVRRLPDNFWKNPISGRDHIAWFFFLEPHRIAKPASFHKTRFHCHDLFTLQPLKLRDVKITPFLAQTHFYSNLSQAECQNVSLSQWNSSACEFEYENKEGRSGWGFGAKIVWEPTIWQMPFI
jgi:hypothetical protein